MCRGNHIHILNCLKTATKGCSTSKFKADCYVLVSTIFSALCWFPQNSSHCSMATKTTMEYKTISLYMCCESHIHILKCKKKTTKGGSTSIFKADCIALISTILCILFWFPPKMALIAQWPRKQLWKVRPYLYKCVVETTYIS